MLNALLDSGSARGAGGERRAEVAATAAAKHRLFTLGALRENCPDMQREE
jgi:hypothetical protein